MKAGLALLLLVSLAAPASATQAEVESGAVATVINSGTAYNPTGIQIGGFLYMYVQTIDPICTSGDPAGGPAEGDVIQAYRAPVDANGVPGAFSFIGRISPCLPSTPDPSRYASFGPGQIFQATVGGTTAYHLLADESDQSSFREIWHGWSPNGVDWTWEIHDSSACPFEPSNPYKTCADPKGTEGITTVQWKPVAQPFLALSTSIPAGFGILNPVMLSTNAGEDNAAWWGYLKFVADAITTTPMLVTFDASGQPYVYLVNSSTQPFTYSYVPGNQITSAGQLVTVIHQGNAKSLLYDATSGVYQLWGDFPAAYDRSTVGCRSGYTVDSQVTCWDPAGCATESGYVAYGASADAFDLNTQVAHTGTALFWWPATPTSLGDAGFVGSYSRNLPSGYATARTFPFRWNSPNGTRYLFSATNDDNICSQFLFSEFYRMYIVQSQVSPYP